MRERRLTPRQREVLDLLVQLGSASAVAKHLGVEHRTITGMCERACDILGMPFLQAVIAWAEYRSIKTPRIRPANPFDLSDRQRRAWEMRIEGLTYAQIGEAMGCKMQVAFDLVSRARGKIPGEREGQKQAAWRRACTPGA